MAKHYFDKLERLDNLIRIKGTGCPTSLARRLEISQRSVFEYINLLRLLGAPISYCKARKSYYYTLHGGFNFHFNEIIKLGQQSRSEKD